MKKILFSFIALIFLSAPGLAQAFKSAEEAEKKLSQYTVADIDGDKKRLKENQELKIDQMFNDLEEAASLLEKQTVTEGLAYQMERVSLITFIHDPSTFAVDLILPAYQKSKDVFEKAAQKLHSYDRNLLLQTLKNKDLVDSEGNG